MEDILFCIVIYGTRLEQCNSYRTLRTHLPAALFSECVYVHDNTEDNIYLAKAYNQALQIAKQRGKSWLLLLDDDTEVTPQYLQTASQFALQSAIPVAVPYLSDHVGQQLSPKWYNKYSGPFKRLSISKRSDDDVMMAFNSGAMFHIPTFESLLNNFNEDYPLDYLDFDTFYRLAHQGITPAILEATLRHNLSISDSRNYVSVHRYRCLMDAELRYTKQLGTIQSIMWYKLRLVARILKWIVTMHPFVKETAKHLFCS